MNIMDALKGLNYGDVPFGVRLIAASQALGSITNPDMPQTGLALMAGFKKNADEQRKAQEELQRKTEIANRLADKIELSNPTAAAALRADPSLVDEYMKGQMSLETYKAQKGIDRGYQLEDRAYNEKQDAIESQRKHEQAIEQLRIQFGFSTKEAEAKVEAESRAEAEKLKRQQELIFGPSATAPATESGVPGPQTSVQQVPVPTQVADASGNTPVGFETIDPMYEKFKEVSGLPDLSPMEFGMLKRAFATDPGKFNDTLNTIIDNRNNAMTAQAAKAQAEVAAAAKDVETRTKAAESRAASANKTDSKIEAADNVLNAISDIRKEQKAYAETPTAEKGLLDRLPPTGTGAYVSSFISETPARAVWNAINTVQANLGFEQLQKIKESSPTGGALGQVSERELLFLQSVVASLDPTDKNFDSNLKQVEDSYKKIKEINTNYKIDSENLAKYPTSENIKQYDEWYGPDAHLRVLGRD